MLPPMLSTLPRLYFVHSLALAIALFFMPVQASANQETNFVITVKAQDAKFIGTAAGGAHIIIRDRRTGDILADGVTFGDTGDTAHIMAETIARDTVLRSENSARLEFSLELWEPTPVTIEATAPLGQPQSLVTVTQDMLIIPGKDYAGGNGIMLEMPGFAVDVLAPAPNSRFPHDPDTPVTVETNVMKLCGCLVAADTPWDPERYEVEAHIYRDSRYITSFAMSYAEEPGLYVANINVPLPGTYRVAVTAFDPVTKEAGTDSTTIILEELTEETP